MKPLNATEITGTWATLLLPINDDESIDFARLADEIDAITATSVSGVYSNGTAGEFYTQTEAEFDRVNELLADKCERAKLPFQIGVSHTSPQTSLSRLQRAITLKPSAVQIILPDWFVLTEEEGIHFLSRMVKAAGDVGLVLYNPPHAKKVVTGETMARFAQTFPQLVGAKVGNVDVAYFAAVRSIGRPFSVFTPGHMLGRHVPMGSAGAYSNLACLSPSGAQRWFHQLHSNPSEAQAFQQRLLAFFDAHITPLITQERFANPAVDKLLAAVGNWAPIGTRMRWPYRSIPLERAVALRPLAREHLPELFE